jgi:Ca-activated chloride channel family protein
MVSQLRRLVVLFAVLIAAPAWAADRTIIVLDASGSMWGQIDGKPKLQIAREALRTVLKGLPADREIGLMAYGHRQKASCDDIQLVVPPAAGTADQIVAAADQMKFLGKTPLTEAVRQAAQAMRYTEDKSTVILITDGLETCSGDPCALGRELEQSGVDFTAHVVGFGLTADEGKQVACLAENTGGKYFQADDAPMLMLGLKEAVAAEPEPAPEPAPAPEPEVEFNFVPNTVLAEGDAPLQDANNAYEIYKAKPDGSKGERVTTEYNNYKGNLEPGPYVVRATLGVAAVEQPVTIVAGEAAKPLFVLNAGTLVLSPKGAADGEVNDSAALLFEYEGGQTTYYGKTTLVVPAGQTKVTATIGSGSVTETFELSPGTTVEKDIIVGVGHVTANALYAEGSERVEDSGLFTRIVKAKKKIDGTREELSNTYGPDARFDVPAGDYVAIVKMDKAEAEAPFTAKVGEPVDVTVVLDAGVLAISAPNAYSIEVFGTKKDLQGNRKSFGRDYGDTRQSTLPAGDYVVVRELPDNGGSKEMPVTVKAGERTEITIE